MTLEAKEEASKVREVAEWEYFVRKQKEMKEQMEREKESQEREHKENMRNRLAGFNLKDDQIEALISSQENKQKDLQPEVSTRAGRHVHPIANAPQPTYANVHRNYLDVETLHYYDVPHEYDASNPEYIIVFREMSARETDILVEHTRRLGTAHGNQLFIEAGDKDSGGKKEYAFVRKKARAKSRSVVDASSSKTNAGLGDMFFR
jgi:hypothetical protein